MCEKISIQDLDASNLQMISDGLRRYAMLTKSVNSDDEVVTVISPLIKSENSSGKPCDTALIMSKNEAKLMIRSLDFTYIAEPDNVAVSIKPSLAKTLVLLKKRYYKHYRESVYDSV